MKDNESTGFLTLVNANLGIAHKICRIYMDSARDREDLMQEMMYQLWCSYRRFDGRSKFSTWMYRVCLNTALTYRKKSIDNRNESLTGDHNKIAAPVPANREAQLELLSDAIATLSPLNKAIILLYLDDLSYAEISGVTGLTRSNVSVRLVRIKKELESKLKEKLTEFES